MSLTRITFAVATLGAVTSCSAVYSGDFDKKQCEKDADCTTSATELPQVCSADRVCVQPPGACLTDNDCLDGNGNPDATQRCGFDRLCYSRWGCLSNPPDFVVTTTPFHVKTAIQDSTNLANANPGAFTFTGCSSADPQCVSPTPTIAPGKTTLGQIEVTPGNFREQADITFDSVGTSGFTGMFKIEPMVAPDPNDPNGFLTSFLHVPSNTPWVGEYTTYHSTFVSTKGTSALISVAIPSADTTKAIATIAILDCGGKPAPNVVVDVTEPTTSTSAKMYPVDSSNIPVGESGQSALLPTTDEGRGAIVNLTPQARTRLRLRQSDANGNPGATIDDAVYFFPQLGGSNFMNYYPRYSAVKAWMASGVVPGESATTTK